jgi:hypothetical protein
MDENRRGYSLKAPGSSGSPLRLPGREPFPPVDEHLVVPEVTRDEIIGGRRVVAMPAQPPHATKRTDLRYLVRAHVAPGYTAAADLLTRHDQDSDFATDACIFKNGVNPATGTRHLEEIAFQVVSEQNERNVTEKALRMHRRGVRRIFAIWIEEDPRVCEWSAETQSWRTLEPASRIEDPCLVAPLAVTALLDAKAADNAVLEALAAKNNPVLRKLETAAALSEGRAEGVLMILETRGLPVSTSQRQEILSCRDLDRLDQWLRRAILATTADEVVAEP